MSALSVSVVIPTYNRVRLLGRAIDSALAAVVPGDEIIVVDDGSTDDTRSMLAAYGDRIRYVWMPNGGVAAARNRGIREASKALVAFLDSDDEWMPDKLTLQRTVLERHPDVLFTGTDFALRDVDGQVSRFYLAHWHQDTRSWDEIVAPGVPYSALASLPPGRADFPVHVGDLHRPLLRGVFVFTGSLVARREAGEALRFAEDLPIYEDWDCFARLAAAGRFAHLACETVWNHGHRGPRVSDADPFTRATCRIVMMKRLWGADAAFLARAGDEYRRILAEQRRARARGLIRRGRTREAREELTLAGGAPLAYRAAARLPGPLARGIVTLGRAFAGAPRPSRA